MLVFDRMNKIEKSEVLRIFHRNQLDTPKVRKALKVKGTNLDKVLETMEEGLFVDLLAGDKIRSTRRGQSTRHPMEPEVADFSAKRGVRAPKRGEVKFYSDLKDWMRNRCTVARELQSHQAAP